MTNAPLLCQQRHALNSDTDKAETRTLVVLVLTLITMAVEIIAALYYGSMALLADGWHMGTHAAAFVLALFAYRYARRHANNPAFTFGTGKVNVLGGFTSAVALGIVALLMIVESTARLFNPQTIQFDQALWVALIGLAVNAVCAVILKGNHEHAHDHSHEHNTTSQEDHNLKAAYWHVIADALTSVLAIAALLCGKFLGIAWLDPVMGIVGAFIISVWAIGLIKQTSPILLDASIEEDKRQAIIQCLEDDNTQVQDLHIWRVSGNHYAAMIALNCQYPASVVRYKQRLHEFPQIAHVTLEINTATQ